jgi:hypothetical protein
MAKPLIEGFGAYCNAVKQDNVLTEASLWNGDFSTFLAAPASVYVTYKLYRCVIFNIIQILCGKRSENNFIHTVIDRIRTDREAYRKELIEEVEEVSDKPVAEMTEKEIIAAITNLMEKSQENFGGLPIVKYREYLKKNAIPKGTDENGNPYYYYFGDFEHHGGLDYTQDNPGAKRVRVYTDRAMDAIKTIPATLIGLFSGLILNNDKRIEFYTERLEQLATWSGSWRRSLDDIVNTWKENWHYTNKQTSPPSRQAAEWVNKNQKTTFKDWDEWNSVMPDKNTALGDAIGLTKRNI